MVRSISGYPITSHYNMSIMSVFWEEKDYIVPIFPYIKYLLKGFIPPVFKSTLLVKLNANARILISWDLFFFFIW